MTPSTNNKKRDVIVLDDDADEEEEEAKETPETKRARMAQAAESRAAAAANLPAMDTRVLDATSKEMIPTKSASNNSSTVNHDVSFSSRPAVATASLPLLSEPEQAASATTEVSATKDGNNATTERAQIMRHVPLQISSNIYNDNDASQKTRPPAAAAAAAPSPSSTSHKNSNNNSATTTTTTREWQRPLRSRFPSQLLQQLPRPLELWQHLQLQEMQPLPMQFPPQPPPAAAVAAASSSNHIKSKCIIDVSATRVQETIELLSDDDDEIEVVDNDNNNNTDEEDGELALDEKEIMETTGRINVRPDPNQNNNCRKPPICSTTTSQDDIILDCSSEENTKGNDKMEMNLPQEENEITQEAEEKDIEREENFKATHDNGDFVGGIHDGDDGANDRTEATRNNDKDEEPLLETDNPPDPENLSLEQPQEQGVNTNQSTPIMDYAHNNANHGTTITTDNDNDRRKNDDQPNDHKEEHDTKHVHHQDDITEHERISMNIDGVENEQAIRINHDSAEDDHGIRINNDDAVEDQAILVNNDDAKEDQAIYINHDGSEEDTEKREHKLLVVEEEPIGIGMVNVADGEPEQEELEEPPTSFNILKRARQYVTTALRGSVKSQNDN